MNFLFKLMIVEVPTMDFPFFKHTVDSKGTPIYPFIPSSTPSHVKRKEEVKRGFFAPNKVKREFYENPWLTQ